MKQNITIRMGAAHHDVSVGSINVDLSKANKTERYEARRALIEGLKETGYFGKKEQRKAVYRKRREAQL
ncbi:valyl-tRNA synthetase [Sinorhizobium fredii]|uniref:hypothetical protein n=1 Tax=Rhizobium fredii TaxID=380 RepID=UPI003512C713